MGHLCLPNDECLGHPPCEDACLIPRIIGNLPDTYQLVANYHHGLHLDNHSTRELRLLLGDTQIHPVVSRGLHHHMEIVEGSQIPQIENLLLAGYLQEFKNHLWEIHVDLYRSHEWTTFAPGHALHSCSHTYIMNLMCITNTVPYVCSRHVAGVEVVHQVLVSVHLQNEGQ